MELCALIPQKHVRMHGHTQTHPAPVLLRGPLLLPRGEHSHSTERACQSTGTGHDVKTFLSDSGLPEVEDTNPHIAREGLAQWFQPLLGEFLANFIGITWEV